MLATPRPDVLQMVACPACGSESQRQRYTLQRSHIVACTACEFTYVSPRAPEAERVAKLQAWAKQDVVDEARLHLAFDRQTRRLYARYLAHVTRLLPRRGRSMLEIGCATGGFCAVARDAGWDVEGLEIGEASAAYAREHLGLPVTTGSLFTVDLAPETYDCIVCLEVIEHLDAPVAALQRMRRWLKPGGVVLLSTPNFDALYRRVYGSAWWVVNCEDEHIVFFTPDTLKRMMRACGLSPEWEHIRGMDLAGMVRQARIGGPQVPQSGAPGTAYYAARNAKEGLKSALRRLRILGLVRGFLRGLDLLWSTPWLPTYGLGEQIVLVARRESEPQGDTP